MRFFDLLAIVTALLRLRKRISYRALQLEFELDDAVLEALRFELVQVEQVALDQDGELLVWAGGDSPATSARESTPGGGVGRSLLPLAPIKATSVAEPSSPRPPSEAGAHTALPTPSAAVETSDAERRPLTVMFCDLADSTALSTKLDPEDLQDVIRGYQERCTAIVREYEGFVAKYMGDGILVYFGYPKALERNAERAVRSGLAIVEAMVGLNAELGRAKGIEIAVRIGIATGLVVVGEVVGEGMAQERTVIGEAPNVAARLQGLAARNGIVVGTLTKEIVGDGFVYEDLGGHELKGIAGRVQAWRVSGLRDAEDERADEAETESGAPPQALIGRDEETGLLRRAWQSTKDEGRGQVVLISGEAGIGKSVLVEGLRAEVRAEGLPRIAFRCSPYHTNSALYPVIEHLKRLAGWEAEDALEARLAKLEAMLEGFDQPLTETVPLLASLLSLPLPEGRHPPLSLTPQQQKQQTQDAIIAMTLEAAEREALLELWEDLHWADPSTLELLGLLIEQAPTASLLMVLTARPEFVPPWPARSHMTPITLNRLERPHSEALVTRLAGDRPLPAEVVEHVVAKTDGVPLYVEELTKTILASAILRDVGDRFELTGPLASLAIPDTLQESLMARLDRLPQVREFAQLGAVLGREFAYEMISGLSTVGESTLQEGLGQLVESELLYQRGRPPRARYIFKHALVQDAAYQSLLRRTRQQHHQQVAELLEAKFPEVVEAQPELVAHHYAEANVADRAVVYFQKAGQRAAQRSANPEAIAHLTKGLEVLRAMPDGPERARRELALLTTMGPALMFTKGYAAPEVETAYRRAVELCQEVGDTEQQFSALHGVWYFHHTSHVGDLEASRNIAQRLVDLAEAQEDPYLIIEANRSLGYTLNYLGELEAARLILGRVISAYDPEVQGADAFRFGGSDPGVGALCMLTWSDWAVGYPDQAVARYEDALALARKLDHPISETFAHVSAAMAHQFRGEPQASQVHAENAAEIAEERGFAVWIAWTTILRCTAICEQGGGAEAIAEVRRGLDASRATGVAVFVPYWLALLAGNCGRHGQADAGLAAITDALAEISRTGERFWEAELHRLKGQLLLASDAANQPEAEACFQKAIEIARSQEARSWELRAATSLARLWRDQGKPDAARDLLAPGYGWFTEGFDTADLKEAKALLDELG